MDPITELLTTYNDLNSPSIDTLTAVPSPLEFLRFVARNRPFVVRGGAAEWKATRTWSVDVLKERMSGLSVNVASTPKGYVIATVPVRFFEGCKLTGEVMRMHQ